MELTHEAKNMTNLEELKHDLENYFIYELQNLPTELGQPTSYFTKDEIEEALISSNGKASNQERLLFAVVRLLKTVCKDEEDGVERSKLLGETNGKFADLLKDYENLLTEIRKMNSPRPKLPFAIPETKDDEVLIVKVGTEDRPASADDIADVQKALAVAKAEKDITVVTHHAIDFVVLKKDHLNKVVSYHDI